MEHRYVVGYTFWIYLRSVRCLHTDAATSAAVMNLYK